MVVRMKKEEFDKNCEFRWGILKVKQERYGEAWRGYSIPTLMKLAQHRMEEVIMVFEDTGRFDLDNYADSMNLADFVLRKMLERGKEGMIK